MNKLIYALVGSVLALAPVTASAEAPYYEGKQITLLIGWPTGGGSDLFGRIFAERLGPSIEGNPTVIVQNMPGAASVTALNHFVQSSPRDGTVIFVGTGNLLFRMMLGADKTVAKVSDLQPIVAAPMGRITYTGSQAGVTSPDQLKGRTEPMVLGVIEPLSTLQPTLQFDMLDVPVKTVMGYPGKAETRLAVERGEVDVDEQTTPVFERNLRSQVKEGKAIPLFAQGLIDGDKLIRDPAAPDIPTIAEIYKNLKGTEPSGQMWDTYKSVVTAYGNAGKILLLHSDIPDPALQALRHGFDVLLKDPQFQKGAKDQLEGYDFIVGDQLVETVKEIANMAPENVAWLKQYLNDKFQLKFN